MSFAFTKKSTEMVTKWQNLNTVLLMLESRFDSRQTNQKKYLIDMCQQLANLKNQAIFQEFIWRMSTVNKMFGTETRLDQRGIIEDFIRTVICTFGLTDPVPVTDPVSDPVTEPVPKKTYAQAVSVP